MNNTCRLIAAGSLALAIGGCGEIGSMQQRVAASGYAPPEATPMSLSSSTFAARSDAIMNYVETNYPSLFPGHSATQAINDQASYPIRFRVYANGVAPATYWWGLGVPRIYYTANNGGTWSYYGTLEDGNTNICGGKCWAPDMPSEVGGVMTNVLNLTGMLLNGGVTQQFSVILSAVLSSTPTTCPVVVTNPSLTNATTFPSTLNVSVNYGNGCIAQDGSTMAGSATANLTNVQFTSTAIGANITANFNNVYRNGKPFANGGVTGNVAFSSNNGALGGTAAFHLTSFLMPTGESATGDITVQPTGGSLGNFNATLNSSTQITPVAGLNLNGGSQQLTLAVQQQSSGAEALSGTGNMYGYSMQFSNLLFNTSLCSSYPVGGSVVFTKNGKTGTVTYGSACDGSYTYQ